MFLALVCLSLGLWPGAAGSAPSLPAVSAHPVIVTNDTPPELAAGHIFVLRDPSGRLTLKDVSTGPAKAGFKQAKGRGISLGYARDTVWLRLAVTSAAGPRKLYLSLGPNANDWTTVYVLHDDTGVPGVSTYRFGDHMPRASRPIPSIEDIVPLTLEAGRRTDVFIKLQNANSSMELTPKLIPADAYPHYSLSQNLYFGIWFGAMTALALVQLAFWFFERQSFYLWLVLSSATTIMFFVGKLGYASVLLFPGGGSANDTYIALCSWFGLLATSQAISRILDLKGRSPWLFRGFQAASLIGALGVFGALAGWQQRLEPILVIVSIAVVTAAALSSVASAFRGTNEQRLYAASFLIQWLGLAVTLAQGQDAVGLPSWMTYAYGATLLAHNLILAAAFAVRLRAAEDRHALIKSEALYAAQGAEQRAMALVEEKTGELARAKQLAEDALAAELQAQDRQVQFMEVISHQYRTPLSSIRSNADGIGLSLPPHDRDNQRRIERIRRATDRLTEVLEVNLARSRLQGPSFRPQIESVSLRKVAAAASGKARLLGGRNIAYDAESCRDVETPGDEEMLVLAVLNLLENATKYSPPDTPISLTCSIEDHHAVVTVRDLGIGIPEAELERVLQPSIRGSNTGGIEGTGMGLSLVSRIVDAHSGRLTLESGPGAGVTVRIFLPLISDAGASCAAP